MSVLMLDADGVRDHRGAPLYLFVGVSTEGSAVHHLFDLWAPVFAGGSVLAGVNLPEGAAAGEFRQLVAAMRENPAVHGAVITSHKLRLYQACADLFDSQDPLVELTHEVNSLDTRHGRVRAFARDAESLEIVLAAMDIDFRPASRPIVCIGAGGSAIALALACLLDVRATLGQGRVVSRPAAQRRDLTIVGRRRQSIDEVAAVVERLGLPARSVHSVVASSPADCARAVSAGPAGSIVANATGLGKFGPGTPLPPDFALRADAVAWDFNYRGPLTFLDHGRDQSAHRVDGWDYFIAGWSAALAAITGRSLDLDLFDTARRAVADARPRDTV